VLAIFSADFGRILRFLMGFSSVFGKIFGFLGHLDENWGKLMEIFNLFSYFNFYWLFQLRFK
jgi:hypothetical protein